MTFFKQIKTFYKRNTCRIETYRLQSYFNLLNNNFDNFFSRTTFRKKLFKSFFRIKAIFKYICRFKSDIPSMDFNLTTSCNLKCKDCASLMPYYDKEHQWTISLDKFKKDLNKLLLSVNKIYRLKLIGGEPLLVPNLDKMLEYACSKKQVISVIITTNALLLPDEKLFNILNIYRKKALVEISDYSDTISQPLQKEITDRLNLNKIYYFISNYEWFECGKIYKRNRNKEALKTIYENCFQNSCLSYFDGKFYNCTKAAAINRLTNHSYSDNEVINIRNNETSQKEITAFFTKDYYSFCDFCSDNCAKRIPRGIQTKETYRID